MSFCESKDSHQKMKLFYNDIEIINLYGDFFYNTKIYMFSDNYEYEHEFNLATLFLDKTEYGTTKRKYRYYHGSNILDNPYFDNLRFNETINQLYLERESILIEKYNKVICKREKILIDQNIYDNRIKLLNIALFFCLVIPAYGK